jgi:preprotein translocase subunit SecD
MMPMSAFLGLATLLLLANPAAAVAAPGNPSRAESEAGAGGVELLLQADGADFGRSRAAMMESEVRHAMEAEGIAIAQVSATGERLSFRVRAPARAGAALRRAQAAGQGDGGAGRWDARIVRGNRIVMHEDPASRARAMGEALDAARQVIVHRIDALGAREASVVRQGPNRLLVRAVGIRDPAAVRALIVPTARLELRLVDLSATAEQLASGRAPAGSQILPYAADRGEEGARMAVQRRVLVSGDMIASARQVYDEQDGRPVINITFNDEGRRRFAQGTRENVGRQFAIVLDNVVIVAPNINEPILGGTAQISGAFTVESANRLAIWLGSGALPIRLAVIEERTP